MKKRLFRLVRALALCLCLLPAAALAEETETVPTEPTIGSNYISANGVPITIEQGSTAGFSKIKINGTGEYLNFGSAQEPVYETDLSAFWIYGGSESGEVSSTSVTMEGGSVYYIYGGGFNGAVTGDSAVTMEGGSVHAIYGGGYNGAVTGNSAVTMEGGSVFAIYGGGEIGAVTGNSAVIVNDGNVTYAFGGGGSGRVDGQATATVNGGTVNYGIFGGGSGIGSSIGTAKVTVTGGTVNGSVYGGGNFVGTSVGAATVTVTGGTVNGSVYGGGSIDGTSVGTATVTVTGGTVNGSVYGGGSIDGTSVGTATVTVTGGTVEGSVYGEADGGTVTGAKNGLVTLAGKADADSFDNLLYHADETSWTVKGSCTLETGNSLALPEGNTLTIGQDTALTIGPDAVLDAGLGQMAVGSGGALAVQGKLNANRLQLTQGAALTVADGGALEVNTLHLDGIETLTIEQGGSLTADAVDQEPEAPVAVVNNGVLEITDYIYGSHTGTGRLSASCDSPLTLDAEHDLFAPGVTWDAESRTLTLSGAGLGAVQFPADAAIVLEPGTDNLITRGVLAAGNLTVRGSAGALLTVSSSEGAALQASGAVTVDSASLYLYDTSRAAGLTVAPGSTLTVCKESALTVSGLLDNQGDILIMDDAALQFEGEVEIRTPGRVTVIGGSASIPDALKQADGISLTEEPYPFRISGGVEGEDFDWNDDKSYVLHIHPGASLTLSGIPGADSTSLEVFIDSSEPEQSAAELTDLTLDGVSFNVLDMSAPTALHLSGQNSVQNIFSVSAAVTVDGSGSLNIKTDIDVRSGTLAFNGGTVTVKSFSTAIVAHAEGETAQCPVAFGPGLRLDPDCAFQSALRNGNTIFYLTENGAALELDEFGNPTNAVKSLRIYPQRSSGGGSSSSSTTTTEKHEDGSITTIKTDKNTGTVTETTKRPDGSVTIVETKKDGAITTTEQDKAGNKTQTVEKPDGSITTTETRTDGTKVETETTAAGKTTAAVTLPAGTAQATVTIPTPEKPTAGIVAVIVHEDGTRELVKTSIPGENGLTLTLTEGAKLEIVDNAKAFGDVPEKYWGAQAIAFVTARELFNGTGADTFSPDAPMSRAMVWTVLTRLSGQDTAGGAVWYEQGMAWARDNGVSDGSNPDGLLTREQLAAMLYRYAGSPATAGSLADFADADTAAGYAADALRWAVERGILSGKGGGVLDPKGLATRAEVAAMLMRYLTQT